VRYAGDEGEGDGNWLAALRGKLGVGWSDIFKRKLWWWGFFLRCGFSYTGLRKGGGIILFKAPVHFLSLGLGVWGLGFRV
jgi:hypothetical protein